MDRLIDSLVFLDGALILFPGHWSRQILTNSIDNYGKSKDSRENNEDDMQSFRLMDYLSNPMEKLASIQATKQRTSYHVYTMRMEMSIVDIEKKDDNKRTSKEKLALPSVNALDWCNDLNVSMLGKLFVCCYAWRIPPVLCFFSLFI